MQISVTARGIKMTPSMKEYSEKKVGKLEEFFNNILKTEVVLEARSIEDQDRAQVAEIRAWLAGKKVVVATEGAKDIYAAIDLAVEEIKRQVQKHKQMHQKEKRRKASREKHRITEASL